jgi:sugar lactone lactonase YvrE
MKVSAVLTRGRSGIPSLNMANHGASPLKLRGRVMDSHPRSWGWGAVALYAATSLTPMTARASVCISLGGNFCSQAVNTTSGAQNVTVTATVAGTVSTVQVLTLGVSGLDFAPGAGAMTCTAATLALDATCTESVTFSPAYPGVRVGAVVLLDSGNNVLGTAYLEGIGTAGLGVLLAGNVLPVAGDGVFEGPVLDGSPATSASLNHPSSVALDGAGNMYIADRYHNRIRKVTASTGLISTLAGNGVADYTGDGLVSTSAGVSLNAPWGVALDSAGNVYIADTLNNVVREIDASTGVITTIAGTGASGSSGDTGPAIAATLNQPQGVSVDTSGALYIADTSNHRIRMVSAAGIITTVAGDGTAGHTGDTGQAASAELNLPFAVAWDGAGNMYIPDSGNNVVRVVNPAGLIDTYAGTGAAGYTGDNGLATLATLFSPSGVATDAAGNVYIADTQNASIRKVNASTGFISTLAANNVGVYLYNGGGPYATSIYGPLGLVLDGDGNVYFADSLNMRIREIQSSLAVLNFTAIPVRQGSQSTPLYQALENDGNAPLDLASITAQSNAALFPANSTCSLNAPFLAVDGDCQIGVIFAPTAAGNPLFGNVQVADAAVNSPLDIELAGDATLVTSTTTGLESNPNPSGYESGVGFTATVSTGAGTGSLTGTVSFFDGTTALATKIPVGTSSSLGSTTSAEAYFTTGALVVGSHSITAAYINTLDPTHFESTSAVLTQIVLEGTSTVLTLSANPSLVGQSITLIATVAAAANGGILPVGSVTFNDGSAILCTVTLSAGGVAACTTASLSVGLHSLVATYNGDPANLVAGSISSTIRQDVREPSVAVLTSAPNPSQYGSPVGFTVAITSNSAVTPTGMLSIFDGGLQIGTATLAGATGAGTYSTSTLAVGLHTITAAYQGDTNNASATSAPLAQIVTQAQTATSVVATPSPAVAGVPPAISATVRATQGTAIPAGSVLFTDTFDGVAVNLGSASLGPGGAAFIAPTLAVGTHSIVAAYAGSVDYGPSASAPLAVAVQLATTATVVTSTPNPSIVQSAITFSAVVNGNGGIPTGGTVSFTADGTSIGASSLSAAGDASLAYSKLSPGTHSIAATYSGDGNDHASTSPAISQVVSTIPTVTSLGASTTTGANAEVILLASVAGFSGPEPTGTVTFTVGTTTLGSAALNSNGVATLTPDLSLGTYSIVASYPGDALHSSSQSQPVTVAGAATSFNITVTPSSVTMATSQNATVNVTVVSFDNFSDAIGLGCGSLPTGVTCHFPSASVTLKANGTQTIQLTIDTNNPLTGGSSSASRFTSNPRYLLAGLCLPPGLFCCCLILGFRKKHWECHMAPLLASLAVCVLLVTGCTSFKQASATPGTYVIQVNGTGVNSDLSHFSNVTLNITK